ncbi:phospholipid/cholesterol/gamma-HCH transport system permease protein [Cohaesibacter sp. ES.047]|uniref:MlaE family ABC transporter permease n=1 Tax=Cohaesibacter sp. ES.047 TaxID=1798205 RepID=UPI000BB7B536|nr:ABC transporter permease [Cohaesibacter sp. ES.047]SNY94305.1 phospholipid/cholesterol/gamma-HCH transport system permease protein [Cohaesibacter sp. ES.047]
MTDQGIDIAKTAQPPRLSDSATAEPGVMQLDGDWTLETVKEADKLVSDSLETAKRPEQIDLQNLSSLDTSGAWVIVRLMRGLGLDESALRSIRPRHKTLFEAVWETNKVKPQEEKQAGYLVNIAEQTGKGVVEIYWDIKILAHLMGGVLASLGSAFLHPRRIRFTSIVHHLEQTGLKAVPIVAFMSFLVGAIVAQQGAFQLRKFGAEPFVIDLVGILVLREVGILLTAIMVAGRSGSAFTAELGSMRMREEVDAMRVMGLDVIEVLITPRVIALVIALPLLGMVANVAALSGGGMVVWFYSDITPASYISWLRQAIAVNTFMVGVIKAPFMALIIALISCSEGLQVGGSAESLGRRTTAAVVKSIFLMVLVDGIFAIFFAAVGY